MSALVLTESPEAIVIVRRREGLTAAGGSEVTAGLGAAAGEAGAGVLVAIGKGRRGTGHSGVLMKSGPGEETPETMVMVNTEETVHREHPGGRGRRQQRDSYLGERTPFPTECLQDVII